MAVEASPDAVKHGLARRGSHGSVVIGKFRNGTLGLGLAVKVMQVLAR